MLAAEGDPRAGESRSDPISSFLPGGFPHPRPDAPSGVHCLFLLPTFLQVLPWTLSHSGREFFWHLRSELGVGRVQPGSPSPCLGLFLPLAGALLSGSRPVLLPSSSLAGAASPARLQSSESCSFLLSCGASEPASGTEVRAAIQCTGQPGSWMHA